VTEHEKLMVKYAKKRAKEKIAEDKLKKIRSELAALLREIGEVVNNAG